MRRLNVRARRWVGWARYAHGTRRAGARPSVRCRRRDVSAPRPSSDSTPSRRRWARCAGALECVDVASGELHRPEQVEALIAQAAGRIESLGTGECAKLAKYLRNRAPGLVLAQNSVLPRLEALGERGWSMLAVSLGCLCWSLVRALGKRPAHARKRALSRHLLGAYGALQDRLGPESAELLAAVEAVLIERHRASSAIEGFNAALRPYLYVHKGVSQGFLDLFRAWFNLRTRRWGRHKRTSAHELPERTAGRRLAHAARLPALARARMTRGAQARPHITGLPDSESAMPRRSGPSCLGKSVKKINSYLIGPRPRSRHLPSISTCRWRSTRQP